MQGFSLLMGHLLGDFVFQNDFLAEYKVKSSAVCFLHCVLYTLACFLTCWWFLPVWAYLLIGATHFPVDRWRLARKLMTYTGQDKFASGAFAPWSIVIVDNTLHLLVLYLLGVYL